MRKIGILLLLVCATSVCADILEPPTKFERLKGEFFYKIKQMKCSEDKPLYGASKIDGKSVVGCYPCDHPIDVGAEFMGDMCSKLCPNRHDRDKDEIFYDKRRYCRLTFPPAEGYELIDNVSIVPVNLYLGGWVKCPEDKPLFVDENWEGKCQPCDYVGRDWVEVKFGCDKCPNNAACNTTDRRE